MKNIFKFEKKTFIFQRVSFSKKTNPKKASIILVSRERRVAFNSNVKKLRHKMRVPMKTNQLIIRRQIMIRKAKTSKNNSI